MKILNRVWKLFCFQKQSDEFVRSYDLNNVSSDDVRKWFNEPNGSFLGGSIPVRHRQVVFLQPLIDEKIDIEKYDYFVEEHATYDWEVNDEAGDDV
jgi:hypothetical protein